MIDLLAKKSTRGDILINLAEQHLAEHEWGCAKLALEKAMKKGGLTHPERVRRLQVEITRCLGTTA